tara:strand:+ start:621 stop:1367 length:747 start_codon:yes stop_codon:yes gene_type:complete
MGYPELGEDYGRALFQSLRSTKPLIGTPKNRDMELWLRTNRVYEMWTRTKLAKDALKIASTVTERAAIEILLISGLGPSAVADQMLYLFGVALELELIQLYAHYFWNRDLMTMTDWSTFLFDEDGLEAYPNARTLIHVRASDPMIGLWKLGIIPRLDEKKALERVWQDSYMRWLEINVEGNTKDAAHKAAIWSTIMLRTLDLGRRHGSAIASVMDEMYEMSLQLKRMQVRSIEDLQIEPAAVEVLDSV